MSWPTAELQFPQLNLVQNCKFRSRTTRMHFESRLKSLVVIVRPAGPLRALARTLHEKQPSLR